MRVAILDDYQGVAQQFGDWDAVGALAEIATFTDHLADEPAWLSDCTTRRSWSPCANARRSLAR